MRAGRICPYRHLSRPEEQFVVLYCRPTSSGHANTFTPALSLGNACTDGVNCELPRGEQACSHLKETQIWPAESTHDAHSVHSIASGRSLSVELDDTRQRRHGCPHSHAAGLELVVHNIIKQRGNLRVRAVFYDTQADEVEEEEGGPEDCELHGPPVLDQPVREVCGLQNLLVALLGDRRGHAAENARVFGDNFRGDLRTEALDEQLEGARYLGGTATANGGSTRKARQLRVRRGSHG
eukprot:scaffold4801_cov69-Phaeocystis_antarctica.AAC.2